jgi:hypothetical protein
MEAFGVGCLCGGVGGGGVLTEAEFRAAERALQLPRLLTARALLVLGKMVEQVVGEAVRTLRAAVRGACGNEKWAERSRHIYKDAA